MDSHSPFACLLVGQPTLRRRIKLGGGGQVKGDVRRIIVRLAPPGRISQLTVSGVRA